MTGFELAVWAPRAERLEVERGEGVRLELSPVAGGWWRAGQPVHGRYRLVVDGLAVADPRATAQPEGFEGPSAFDDPAAFEWTDAGWTGFPLAAAVLYELHIGTFTPAGTFDAAIGHLDELVELGVNAVEVMPVNTFPGDRGWGYDGVLLYAPHCAYGGPEGMRRFVDACHARGLAVVLDVVYNHLGPSGNHLSRFGPYFTDAYTTPWGAAINLDGPGSDEVRRFFIDNARHWIRDHHVDGLRLDAVHSFHDRSALPFLEELSAAVHRCGDELGRTVWVVAESDRNDPSLVRPSESGGLGLDATWSDDLHHSLHAALTGERQGYYQDFGSVADVARALEGVYVYDGRYSRSRDRRHGRPVGETPRSRFLGYTQTHDQVGNRALGERLCHLTDQRGAEIAAAVVLTSPCVPMLFQGEEWAASTPFLYFVDHADPALADAVRTGRRKESAALGWDPAAVPDPQDVTTFRRSVLQWSERERAPHAEMLAWYRSLIALRRQTPALGGGGPRDTSVHVDEAEEWLAIRRGSAAVTVNLGPATATVPLPFEGLQVRLTNDPGAGMGERTITLAARSVAVLTPRP